MDVERLKRIDLLEDLPAEQLEKLEATQAAGGFFLTNSQVEMVRREAPHFEQKLQSLIEQRGF